MDLYAALQKPKPFERGASIWTDARISPQMLQAHLDGSTDSASYAPDRIDKTVSFLRDRLCLDEGRSLVDLGCGPGLYAERFARQGVAVTGIDISESSIAYATAQAKQAGQLIEYRNQSYCEPFGESCFDAAILVWEDLGVLSPDERQAVLCNVAAALRPGGMFAFDVASEQRLSELDSGGSWESFETGFFRTHPHVVIGKTWLFPETNSYCETSVVVDDEIAVYHNHLTVFTEQRIAQELHSAGLVVDYVGGDLMGSPLTGGSSQLGVVAVKKREAMPFSTDR